MGNKRNPGLSQYHEVEKVVAQNIAARSMVGSREPEFGIRIMHDLLERSEYIRSLQLSNEQHSDDNEGRRKVRKYAARIVAFVLLSSVAFIFTYILFSFIKLNQAPESVILVTWLSTTVIEVIGIMYVIARYLFPQHGIGEDTKKASPVKKDS